MDVQQAKAPVVKGALYKLGLILLLSISFSGLQAQSKSFHAQMRNILSFSVDTIQSRQLLHKIIKKEAVLLDCREEYEFNVSQIYSAKRVGFNDFNMAKMKNIKKDEFIVVYCSVGARSEKIGELLIKNGYTNVHNLYGGIFAWSNFGYPVYSKSKKTDNIHAYDKEWGKLLEHGKKIY